MLKVGISFSLHYGTEYSFREAWLWVPVYSIFKLSVRKRSFVLTLSNANKYGVTNSIFKILNAVFESYLGTHSDKCSNIFELKNYHGKCCRNRYNECLNEKRIKTYWNS